MKPPPLCFVCRGRGHGGQGRTPRRQAWFWRLPRKAPLRVGAACTPPGERPASPEHGGQGRTPPRCGAVSLQKNSFPLLTNQTGRAIVTMLARTNPQTGLRPLSRTGTVPAGLSPLAVRFFRGSGLAGANLQENAAPPHCGAGRRLFWQPRHFSPEVSKS